MMSCVELMGISMGVICDIEMLDIKDINQAYERMKRSDVRYRFVIGMETIQD